MKQHGCPGISVNADEVIAEARKIFAQIQGHR